MEKGQTIGEPLWSHDHGHGVQIIGYGITASLCFHTLAERGSGDVTFREVTPPEMIAIADYLRDAAETMVREREDKEATCRDCGTVGVHIMHGGRCIGIAQTCCGRDSASTCGLDHAALRGAK